MSSMPSLPPRPPPMPASHHPSRAHKLTGISTPVLDLLVGKSEDHATAALPPLTPSFHIKVGNKMIDSGKAARKWVWDKFTSSARNDGQILNHWVRAGVEYPDYPYARFDVHLDSVLYNDEEYSQLLQDPLWTKSETDKLMDLARIFELRWVVIHDRWQDIFQERKMVDLMYRYYQVAALLAQGRIQKEAANEVAALTSVTVDPEHSEQHLLETAAARALATSDPLQQPHIPSIGTGATNKNVFHLEKERERRAHLDFIWNRSKEEELEEVELRKELMLVETQLRKLKKSGAHLQRPRAVSPMPTLAESAALLLSSFSKSAPTPVPGTPYLQSARQVPPASIGGINKNSLKRMDTVLEELHITSKPLPTKRNCDMYDSVRKDILTLMTLQKMVMQGEGMLQTKRLRLAKLGGGGRVIEEETLLGMAPTAPIVATTPPPRKLKVSTKQAKIISGGKGKVAPQKVTDTEGKKTSTAKKKKKLGDSNPSVTTDSSAAATTFIPPVIGAHAPEEDDSKPSAKKRARKN